MVNHHILTVAAQHFGDDSLSLRFSLVDFEFDLEKETIKDVNIENMKEGFQELCTFLDSLE
jgi:hypothetical protein